MQLKTHLAITLLFVLLFISHISHISHKILFLLVVITSSMLPDIDVRYSAIGRSKFARPLQLFVKHRDFIHSFTFCLLITIMLVFWYPLIAFAFFIGYSIHLFVDSFTPEGIAFFWPYKEKSKGKIKAGGVIDKGLFLIFSALDIIVIIFYIISIFG